MYCIVQTASAETVGRSRGGVLIKHRIGAPHPCPELPQPVYTLAMPHAMETHEAWAATIETHCLAGTLT